MTPASSLGRGRLADGGNLVGAIEDSMFAWCDVPGFVRPLRVPGLRGGVSSSANPYANRVGADGLSAERADATIRHLIATFEEDGKGFTWVVGPRSTPGDLSTRLTRAGVVPAEALAGMALRDLARPGGADPPVSVRTATRSDLRHYAAAMAACYGMPTETMRDANAFLLHEANDYRTRVFLAFAPGTAEPVAFGTVVLFHGPRLALLGGSGTHPDHRGRGLYRALLRRRLDEARTAGCEAALVQADRRTSAPILARVGFEELCDIRMHAWQPSGAPAT
ncbi:MAG: GNAT family N-acetyltransferase [Trueperaceae bacterium]|nr:GNAT family N-acetyltransferase [Trueperaceae bacterium]